MIRKIVNNIWRVLIVACAWILPGCVGIPDGIAPVHDFDINRYLGTWYEIARLDHSFERGLSNIHAEYSIRQDGGIDVVNKGYEDDAGKWKEARGKAFFVDNPAVGRLKVSFFGPFYGAYNIIELDKINYSHAVVCGPNRSYLWILARTPELPENTLAGLIAFSQQMGFDTSSLIYPAHDQWTIGKNFKKSF